MSSQNRKRAWSSLAGQGPLDSMARFVLSRQLSQTHRGSCYSHGGPAEESPPPPPLSSPEQLSVAHSRLQTATSASRLTWPRSNGRALVVGHLVPVPQVSESHADPLPWLESSPVALRCPQHSVDALSWPQDAAVQRWLHNPRGSRFVARGTSNVEDYFSRDESSLRQHLQRQQLLSFTSLPARALRGSRLSPCGHVAQSSLLRFPVRPSTRPDAVDLSDLASPSSGPAVELHAYEHQQCSRRPPEFSPRGLWCGKEAVNLSSPAVADAVTAPLTGMPTERMVAEYAEQSANIHGPGLMGNQPHTQVETALRAPFMERLQLERQPLNKGPSTMDSELQNQGRAAVAVPSSVQGQLGAPPLDPVMWALLHAPRRQTTARPNSNAQREVAQSTQTRSAPQRKGVRRASRTQRETEDATVRRNPRPGGVERGPTGPSHLQGHNAMSSSRSGVDATERLDPKKKCEDGTKVEAMQGGFLSLPRGLKGLRCAGMAHARWNAQSAQQIEAGRSLGLQSVMASAKRHKLEMPDSSVAETLDLNQLPPTSDSEATLPLPLHSGKRLVSEVSQDEIQRLIDLGTAENVLDYSGRDHDRSRHWLARASGFRCAKKLSFNSKEVEVRKQVLDLNISPNDEGAAGSAVGKGILPHHADCQQKFAA